MILQLHVGYHIALQRMCYSLEAFVDDNRAGDDNDFNVFRI